MAGPEPQPKRCQPASLAVPARLDRHRREVRLVARRGRPPGAHPRRSPRRVPVAHRIPQRSGGTPSASRSRGEGELRLRWAAIGGPPAIQTRGLRAVTQTAGGRRTSCNGLGRPGDPRSRRRPRGPTGPRGDEVGDQRVGFRNRIAWLVDEGDLDLQPAPVKASDSSAGSSVPLSVAVWPSPVGLSSSSDRSRARGSSAGAVPATPSAFVACASFERRKSAPGYGGRMTSAGCL